MIRRPPRSTLDRSSAASDVYKRQDVFHDVQQDDFGPVPLGDVTRPLGDFFAAFGDVPVSYTHLRAHETVLDLVCRLLLEKKKNNRYK